MKNIISRASGFRFVGFGFAVAVAAAVVVGGFASSVRAAGPGDVIINEFVSRPSAGQEWVELLNTTNDSISLDGWKLTELTSPSNDPREVDLKVFTDSDVIPAHGFIIFDVVGASRLNNPGDSIGLFSASEEINRVTYGNVNSPLYPINVNVVPGENQSAAFYGGVWTVGTPTKGVKNGNTAPVASNASVSVGENSSVRITLSATDADFDSLRFMIVDMPIHGTLVNEVSDSSNQFTYTPNQNFNGADSFTYKANDGTADSNIATVSIMVNESVIVTNHAPTAVDQTVTLNEDGRTYIDLAATDVDSDVLTYVIISEPMHGVLRHGIAPLVHAADAGLSYTPARDYNGTDSFSYRVSDPAGLMSETRTVSLVIAPVNDGPISGNRTAKLNENTSRNIILPASDIDGDALTYSIVQAPAHGTLTPLAANQTTYTSDANYHGNDSFTFKVSDGALESNTATVAITVAQNLVVGDFTLEDRVSSIDINDQVISVDEDVSARITLGPLSVNAGAPLNYTIGSVPINGTLGPIVDGQVTYTPAPNYNGADSFTFVAGDGLIESGEVMVGITVNSVNDAPVSYSQVDDQTVLGERGRPVIISLIADDVDGDRLTYEIVTPPAHGTAYIYGNDASGKALYTSDAGYSGADSFTFKASDGRADSNIATISILIERQNTAPVVTGRTVGPHSVDITGAILIPLVGTDADNDSLTFSIMNAPTLGAATLNGGVVTYIPNGTAGTDTFTYKANDGRVDSNTATVTITLTPGAITKLGITATPATLIAGGTSVIKVMGQDQFGNTVTGDNATVVHLSAGNLGSIENTLLTLTGGEKTTTLTKSGVGTVRVNAWSGAFTPVEVVVTFTSPDVTTVSVTQIAAVRSFATADGAYASGWQWVFDVTVPMNETRLAMKFGDWVSGANSIAAQGNVRYYSGQSSNIKDQASAIEISARNVYNETTMALEGDLDPSRAGRQVQITVEARVPTGSAGGSYSTSYGIQTN